MASYTDKYKQKKSLNALNLNAEELGLEKDFFPKQVWEMYFEGKDPEGEFFACDCHFPLLEVRRWNEKLIRVAVGDT